MPDPTNAGERSRSVDPSTGALLAEHRFLSDLELERQLAQSNRGFKVWRALTVAQRAAMLPCLAAALRQRTEVMARCATSEMGKPVTQARAEMEKCAALCDWYAEHGERLLGDEPARVPSGTAYVSFLPIGVILGVMPWNFPYWQAMRAAIPILLSGNGFLLKPAETVVGCAGLLAEALRDAGLPDGVFGIAHATRDQVCRIIGDERIAAVTLTGSIAAGRSVASAAAQHVKKSVLELGGADPFIVLPDADLGSAATAAALARFQNCGQVCIAAKRFIVDHRVADRFMDLLISEVEALTLGDPFSENTYIGPLARHDLREQLDRQVERTVAQGAELILGGRKLDGAGAYYAPTILGSVRPGMVAFDEETFGPVAAITLVSDLDEAVAVANHSEYGLSASIWTNDSMIAKTVARRLETGGVFVNSFSVSDPSVPIGGVKRSGYGRELSHFGVREFTNAQTVWLDRR